MAEAERLLKQVDEAIANASGDQKTILTAAKATSQETINNLKAGIVSTARMHGCKQFSEL